MFLQVSDYITQCILAGGGRRSAILTQEVTKALLGPHCEQERLLAELGRHPLGAAQVNLVFLLESLLGLHPLLRLLQSNSQFSQHFDSNALSSVQSADQLLHWR